jgi:endonuclease VIII
MPEGDSIHNLAARLSRVLVDREVRAFEAHAIDDAASASVVGRTIVAVDARGKNLLVRFDDGRALHVHLRMLGRLRIERPRSALYLPRRTSPELRLAVDGTAIVGSRIPVLRLLSPRAEERASDLAGLGPDLLAPDHDEDEAVRRLLALGKMSIAEALLLQRAVAGIGNIYKSETLFLERVNPHAAAASLGEERMRAIVRRAALLMRMNLGKRSRVTRPSLAPGAGSRFWVYGRRGRGCFRCGTPIELVRQGAPPGRSTYHCPQCQAG